MNDVALTLRQVRFEQRNFWRNPASGFFAFAFPIILLVVLGSAAQGGSTTFRGRSVRYDEFFVPALIAFGAMGATFTNIATGITIRRDSGVLKRFRGTPLPPAIFMLGVVGSAVIVALVLLLLTSAVGILFYGVSFPRHPGAVPVALAVGAFCFCSLGLALTCFIPNDDAAPAMVNGVFLPLVFISNLFFPIDSVSWLADLSTVFPVRHFIDQVVLAFDPGRISSSGLDGIDLLAMVAWGLLGLAIAVRRFRWEPRKT